MRSCGSPAFSLSCIWTSFITKLCMKSLYANTFWCGPGKRCMSHGKASYICDCKWIRRNRSIFHWRAQFRFPDNCKSTARVVSVRMRGSTRVGTWAILIKYTGSYPAPDGSLKVDHKINSFDKLAERFILAGEAMAKNNSTDDIGDGLDDGSAGVKRLACRYRSYWWVFLDRWQWAKLRKRNISFKSKNNSSSECGKLSLKGVWSSASELQCNANLCNCRESLFPICFKFLKNRVMFVFEKMDARSLFPHLSELWSGCCGWITRLQICRQIF